MEQIATHSRISVVEKTEEEIINAARQDVRHFEPLYHRYYKRIFLFVFHRVADKALAADITSQVFLKTLNRLDQYTHRGLPFSSWLFRIAINECNGHFRKKSVTHVVMLDQHHYHLLTEQLTYENEENKAALHSAIKSLKRSDIQLIELRFFEGLKFQEIAEILDISENNAKVRLYRVLDKLRKKLDRQ